MELEKRRIVLIDADIELYQIAKKYHVSVSWDDDITSNSTDIEAAKKAIDDKISEIVSKLFADDYLLCISGDNNFRKRMFPTYKTNRKEQKPLGYYELKEHLKANHPSKVYSELEADDVMGIMATKVNPADVEYIIYSVDKDMKTIPSLIWSHSKGKVIQISELDANRFLYKQLLTGDTADGYCGCPSVGKIKAERILSTCSSEIEMREAVFKEYLRVYKDEALAKSKLIEQAGQARILRACDFDFKNKTVIIWHPWRDNGDIKTESKVSEDTSEQTRPAV